MFRYSLRALLAHKVRLLLTVAAITVGVAFVSGSLVLSDTMGRAFDELFAGLAKGTDVTVRAQSNDPRCQPPGARFTPWMSPSWTRSAEFPAWPPRRARSPASH